MTDLDKHHLTKEKYEELQRELDILRTEKRKEVVEHLEYAKSLGDLSENAEYQQAREEQAQLEDRINHLNTILKHAMLVGDRKGNSVDIGSTVIVKKNGGEEKTFRMVGSEEADILGGKLSYLSPAGEALMGCVKGDVVKISAPLGDIEYEVVDIK